MRTIRSDPARLVSTTLRYTYELFRAPTYAADYSTRRDGVTPYRSTVSHPMVEAAKHVATAGWMVTLVLVPVGIAGLWLGGRRRALGALGALLAANWLCFTVVFWGMPRYRYAVEPVLTIVAAVGLTVLRDRLTVDADRPGRGGRAGSDRVALEEAAGDHEALDLVGALADDHQRRVAVVALDRELGRVADAAVDAHRLGGDLERGLAREQLRHAGLDVGALARLLQLRGVLR